jgi:hypothetical protein
MRTVKWVPVLSGVFLGALLLWAGAAGADISTTNAAAIVVFPKLVVDTSAQLPNTDGGRTRIDTIIQLTNTAPNAVSVRCFYVNANGHCSNDESLICNPLGPRADITAACGSPFTVCIPGWKETDFAFRLTSKQPITWTVSAGLPTLPLNDTPSIKGEFNTGSIPPSPEDPMIGELKCIEVAEDESPSDQNDLKGEATIEQVSIRPESEPAVSVDARGYNAIGIQAIPGANNHDNALVIGGNSSTLQQEYNGCPANLILDHFFDDAVEPATEARVRTDLTLVPCSEDFNFQAPVATVVQFLVFNEFEQRFSTSRTVRCLAELPLSDIDTRAGNDKDNDRASIFNVNVEGTLTGQTVIRGVADASTTYGHGVLGVAEEFHYQSGDSSADVHSAAFQLQQRGNRTQPDIVLLPGAVTCSIDEDCPQPPEVPVPLHCAAGTCLP